MAENSKPIFRLGDLVRTNVYGTTQEDSDSAYVGFFSVKRFEDFDVTPEEFVAAIKVAEAGEFNDVGIDRFRDGPGYIELGGWLGDQTTALQFMGLGEILGLWEVVTPRRLGIEDAAQAQEMMGMGFVMIAPKQDSLLFA